MDYEKNRDFEEYHRAGTTTQRVHFHRAIEFFYCIDGEIDYLVGNESGTMQAGDFIIVAPMTFHSYKVRGNCWCDVLPADYSEDWDNLAKGKQPKNPLVSGELASDLRTHLLKITPKISGIFKRGIYYYVIGRIFSEVEFIESPQGRADGFSADVLNYVDEHFNEDLTLDELAKHFGYSKYYFSNLFNKHFKTNLKNYVNQVRIAKAVKLLKKYSINEVSGMCGYNSLQAFFYNFKRVTGTSPKSIITSKND